ncbi:MAG: SusF/SusE family outer membrane protein [Marinifilaceae bacterium]|nr:SusF/SusE family outer membrane protein [Marinifilaceae bacterium]
MKNLKYLFISLLAVFFIACEDDFETPNVTEPVQGTAPVLAEINEDIDLVLEKKNEKETIIELSWSAATYTDPIGVRYYVQVDTVGNEFKNALEFDRVSATTTPITVGGLNTLISNRYAPAKKVELEVRIRAFANEDLDNLYTASFTMKVTPYLDVPIPTDLYIFGSATASSKVTDALKAYGADNIFTKYLKLTKDGLFKFSEKQASDGYDYNFAKFATRSENIEAAGDDAGNFKFTGETGWYAVTADFTNSNLTIAPYENGSVYTYDYPNIYLVGAYNTTDPEWNPGASPEMTRKSEGVYTLEVTLKDGANFKFINQQNWDGLDWADADSDGNSGILAPKGKNNNIAFDGADKAYTITLDLNKGIYTIEAVPVFPTKLYINGSFVPDWDWNNAAVMEMIPVHSNPHLFWKIAWFDAGTELKFNAAKAWDGAQFGKTGDTADADGVWSKGGDNIPSGAVGYKMIVVNLLTNTIQITDPVIYAQGTAFGNWDGGQFLFTPDAGDTKILVSPAAVADDNARMYVTATTLTNADGNPVDWWQAEFSVLSGIIEYRGTGNDLPAAPITTGQKVKLNFSTGSGIFE